MTEVWNNSWRSSASKLFSIKNNTRKIPQQSGFTRRDQVVYNRLRAGHTLITHGYLPDNSIPYIPTLCELCNDTVMSVKDILVDCDTLREARRRILGKEDVDMKMLLGSIIGK